MNPSLQHSHASGETTIGNKIMDRSGMGCSLQTKSSYSKRAYVCVFYKASDLISLGNVTENLEQSKIKIIISGLKIH